MRFQPLSLDKLDFVLRDCVVSCSVGQGKTVSLGLASESKYVCFTGSF